MRRLNEQTDRLGALLHRGLLAVAASEGLYLVIMIVFYGVFNADVFMTSQHLIAPLKDYVIMPWAGALMGIYLMNKKRKYGLDIWALTLLILWLIVPFVMRFGTEYFTMYAALGYSLCFFVFYASVSESDTRKRLCQLDIACAGACLVSIVLGGVLLYCAATGEVFYSYWDTQHFGVVNGQLQHMHYNLTGRLALVCLMMCLVGLCRSRKKPLAIFYLTGLLIMTLVAVLTQSRTIRYAMLAAFALFTWNEMAVHLPIKKQVLRHGAALVCAAVVLFGGYGLCSQITDAALAHYAGLPSPVIESVVPSAIAEDETPEKGEESIKARKAVDATFSDRTNIWKNIFKNWKENPWHMLIGNGSGRTKWLIAENTIHEANGHVEAHNAYLHFAAEFGLIGFGLLAVFMVSICPHVARVFFAPKGKRMPGGSALCVLLVGILMTGIMEVEPLDGMTMMGMTLFFVLGQLVGAGRDMKNQE